MSEQKLNRSKVTSLSVDLRHFRPAHETSRDEETGAELSRTANDRHR
jgi:hypothetical protein